MTPSKTRANAIATKVLDALQEADELGGPERMDYINLMENMARVCSIRAATARVTAPEQEVLRWAQKNIHPDAFIESTGGGCTALQIPALNAGADDYWWITDDASAPETLNLEGAEEPFYMCLYRGGQDAGEQWFGLSVRTLEQAKDIIHGFTGVQW